MNAAAHKMAQMYKMTANSSVQGKGRLNPNRAAIWIKKVTNKQRKMRPPNASATFLNNFIAL
jgi:hypothetical protein